MYFNCHNHTEYSNLRLLDCINKPEDLINKAFEMGLNGVAITDHEALCAHMIVNKLAKKYQTEHPDFTIALGNEIYLTDTRECGQKYYHFILIAKDKIGYKALKELSSIAWYNMYTDRRMERVPTLKTELKEVMQRYKGHVIATSACMGGELSTNVLLMKKSEEIDDIEGRRFYYNNIVNFIEYCLDIFGDDFYIECAPSTANDQILVNKTLQRIAEVYNIKMTVGTDSHYLEAKDRFVHKSYLNSKNGDREVDSFYEFSRLMDPTECRTLLKYSFDDEFITTIFNNSNELMKKIEFFSLEQHQDIPRVEVKDYPKTTPTWDKHIDDEYPTLRALYNSDDVQERYWINECANALSKIGKNQDKRYWDRLEEEARVKKIIGEKLNTCMFAYPNTLKHYIDLFWKCGSTVGAGRGSACSGLNHYLLGITQLDPIEWDLPFWRYLNEERVELGDIDLDLAPSKIDKIFEEIRKERGELGLVQVCTFGTEGTKSAILTACRGYRSDDFPDGIDVDEAQYLSSLIPKERGFLWSLSEVVYGNSDKGRKPQQQFITAINAYPGLLEIAMGIEGLVCRRGSHASGVILFDSNIYDSAAIMRTPSGALVTQWDLHMQEAAGSVKYDFLLTAVQDIIIETIELLQEDGIIEKAPLREIYNKYLHPNVLPQDDMRMWKALERGDVINCFQFEGAVGKQAAKKIKPTSPLEMADANGLMRLMPNEETGEMPLDKYVRFKNNINLWYSEMSRAGLTIEEQKTLEPYFKQSYGVPPSQEQLMKMLMDENICNFSLAEANAARKIVGKKLMSKIPELHDKVLNTAKSSALGKYVWKNGIGPQMGYSFSIIHALAYSFVGMQTLYLATNFNPIYWNTACLIVNSGALEQGEDESTNYTKIAKAIGAIREAGIKVSLADINNSGFGFKPDVENNEILFGLKGLVNVGDDLVKSIIDNRPYASPKDFLQKVKPNKQAMIALIKGGAFDKMLDRKLCMAWYIWETCDKKSRLTLQNLNGLMSRNLVPNNTKELQDAKRIYEFTRYLKYITKLDPCKYNGMYSLDERAISFLQEMEYDDLMETDNLAWFIKIKDWDKVYQSYMNTFRTWINSDKDNILKKLNQAIFLEDWNKYASGNISSWEMEALCFYYHEHELANINKSKYGISSILNIPDEPVVDRSFEKNGRTINIFKLYKICGTCIAKNKDRSTVSLLTPDGVIEVKFRKEYFTLFDKQISQKDADGIKHVVEKSWFNKGSMIIVQGIKLNDVFVAKKYNSSQGHQLYKIDSIDEDGDIVIRNERAKGDIEDE